MFTILCFRFYKYMIMIPKDYFLNCMHWLMVIFKEITSMYDSRS